MKIFFLIFKPIEKMSKAQEPAMTYTHVNEIFVMLWLMRTTIIELDTEPMA